MIPTINTVTIEAVTPQINGGRYAIKRIVGDLLQVEADIFTHGHEVVRGCLLFRRKGAPRWNEAPLEPLVNDRWRGAFPLEENGVYEYTLMAWRDPYLSWAAELHKKLEADQDVSSELLEGKALVLEAMKRADPPDKSRLQQLVQFFDRKIGPDAAVERLLELLSQIPQQVTSGRPIDEPLAEAKQLVENLNGGQKVLGPKADPIREVILGDELTQLMKRYPDRSDRGQYRQVLKVFAERPEAQCASWYEMWPRSQGTTAGQSATFVEMEGRLSEIHQMGFSVVYLTPIHPIGQTNRKGPNNSLICPPGSPGCPYAIGNEQGGHTAIEPSLGTLEDFRHFEQACRALGMELALDIALQTSPDHPWVKEHPQWFKKRPDGSIKFAENPPKKYEDIYPLDFNTEDPEGLWREVLAVLRFWIDQGVRIFRIDNPHTKPIPFWEWLIDQVHDTDPDVIFLAEAFTRPKMMKALAKAGFTQSYTYFTWRNFKQELIEYFTELTQTEVAEYLRGNLFTNTPDILPEFLQNAPRSAFKIRATLAATLSSCWGMYNGFELCEGSPLPGREEYQDSEKYQFKVWDWDRPGNIKEYIGRLNHIRQAQPALQEYCNLQFHGADDDNILFYSKRSEERRNIILVAVNLDPFQAHESQVHVPLELMGLSPDETYQLHDLISDRRYFWKGESNFIRLDPGRESAHIFQLLRWSYREQDFDYFL